MWTICIVFMVGGLALLGVGLAWLLGGLSETLGNIMNGMTGGGGGAEMDTAKMIKGVIMLAAGLVSFMGGAIGVRFQVKRDREAKKRADDVAAIMSDPMTVWAMQQAAQSAVGAAPQTTDDKPAVAPKQQGEGYVCASCSKPVQKTYNVCPYCAAKLAWGGKRLKCSHCGEEMKEEFIFCPTCGAPAEMTVTPEMTTPAERKCMYCGAVLAPEQDTCPNCNHKYIVRH